MLDYVATLSRIERQILGAANTYTSAQKRADGRKGSTHGKKNIPARNESTHPFREELLTDARTHISTYRSSVNEFEHELTVEEDKLQRERDEFYVKRRHEALDQFNSDMDSAERKIGDKSVKHSRARKECDEAMSKFRQIEADLGRPLRIRLVWELPDHHYRCRVIGSPDQSICIRIFLWRKSYTLSTSRPRLGDYACFLCTLDRNLAET